MNLETSLSNAICGHEHQRMRLARLLHTNRLPQSMIFAGPTGIGKSLVAAELVQTIFCDKGSAQTYGGCGECKSCHLFAVGNHPDLHLVDCNQWKVDQVRELLSALALKSYEGRARAVIFNDAEQLNTQSLNALLKTLEEPRPDTYFVLVTSNPAKLLQTVLSRCHKFHFDPLTAAEVELLITKGNIETGELTLKEITLLSDGSMENIEKLSEHAATWKEIQTLLAEASTGSIAGPFDAIGKIGKDKEGLPLALDLMRIYARNQIHEVQDSHLRLKWAVLLENIILAQHYIFDRNLNAVYVLNALILEFAQGNPSLSERLLNKIAV